MSEPHPFRYTHPKGQRCRCDYCRIEATRRRKRQRLNSIKRQRGAIFPYDMVSGKEAATLVQTAVRRYGYTAREVGRITGTGSPTIQKLLRSSLRDEHAVTVTYRVHQNVVKGLTDCDERNLLPGSLVPIKRSQQLVRSMCAQGWSQQHQLEIIEKNLGQSGYCILHVMRSGTSRITKEVEDRIVWLSQAIGERVGPSQILITKYKNWGYFPLKHYSVKGDLIVTTLSPEQRAIHERLR